MGNFYANVLVRAGAIGDVLRLLGRLDREAFVADGGRGFWVVLDRECDNFEEGVIQSLALTLSVRLDTPALAVTNHDDGELLVWLFDGKGGELAWKWRTFFGWDARRADIFETVRATFGTQARPTPRFQGPVVLRLLSSLAPSAVAEHERLAVECDLPELAVGMGFSYALQGELKDRGAAFEQTRARVIRPRW